MKLRNILPVFAIIIALALAFAVSGFHEGPSEKNTLYFYEYVGPDFSQANIQDPDNYERSSQSCSGAYNVCGVLLSLDEGMGNPPDPSDFSTESTNLWSAQQQHKAVNGNIIMKN